MKIRPKYNPTRIIMWVIFWFCILCFGYEAIFTEDVNNSENYLLVAWTFLIYLKMGGRDNEYG